MKKNLQETQRVRIKEAEEAIFNPNSVEIQDDAPDINFGIDPVRDVIVYTSFGKHDYLDGDDNPILGDESENSLAEDRPLAFAKEVSVNGRNSSYYVKRASGGRFYNPQGIDDEGRHNKQLHHTGKSKFEYHTVNKRSFEFYVAFLRTRNLAQLRNAERENF